MKNGACEQAAWPIPRQLKEETESTERARIQLLRTFLTAQAIRFLLVKRFPIETATLGAQVVSLGIRVGTVPSGKT